MLSLYQPNLGAAVTGNSAPRASRRIGLSVAALLMAGTALAPTQAQVADLGGLTVSRNDFVNFNPPGTGITPSEITNGTLRINPLTPQTFAGDLTNSLGPFSLIKLGTGDLTLAGVNIHSGNTSVLNGRLIAGSLTAFSSASRLNVAGPAAGLATADLNGFNQTVNGLQGNGTGVVTSTNGPALLTINTSTNLTFNGALQGQLGIVKRGTSTQTFANLNPGAAVTNATGPITLQAGTLRIGSSNALGSGAMTVTGAGTLSEAGVGPLVFDNNITLQATLTAAAAAGQSLTMNGVIDGAGSLRKMGVGLVTLNGGNLYAGGTTLSGGRLLIGNATALGSGLVTQTQTSVIGLADPATSLTVANAFQMNGSSLQLETPDVGVVFTLSGAIGGSADVNLVGGNGGTVVLGGANSFSGLVRLRSGTLGITNAAGVNSATAIRAEAGNRNIVILAANQVVSTRLFSHVGDGALTVTVNTGVNNVEFSNALRDASTVAGDTLAIVKTGAGIFTASNASATALGSNLVSGGFSVAEGTLNLTGRLSGDITAASGTVLAGTGTQSAGATTIGDGATLSAGDARLAAPSIGTLTLNNLTLGATASTIFDLGAPSIDTAASINDLIIVSGNLNLGGSTFNFNTLTGFTAGTYRLMTYGGALSGTATLGVLPVGFTYALSTGGGNIDLNVTLNDFYWDGSGPFGNARLDGGNGTWNAGNTNFTDIGGNAIVAWQNNARTFFTTAGGEVVVDGTFTYSTLIFTVDGYVLNPAAGATLGANAGAIDVAAATTATINVDLVGTGGLTKSGAGTLVLGGTNSYTTTQVLQGTLAFGRAASVGSGDITVSAGTVLRFDAGMTLANNINGSGIYSINTNGNDVVFNGSLSGGGADKRGLGTLTLNNAVNAQPGVLAVFAGTLELQGAVQGDVAIFDTARLIGGGSITGQLFMGNGSTLRYGNSPATLSVDSMILNPTSSLIYDLDIINTVNVSNDLIVVSSDLTLDGMLSVVPGANFNIGTGAYTLITYGNLLADGGLLLTGLTAPAGVVYTISTTNGVGAGAGSVLLNVAYNGQFNWDGIGMSPNGTIQGGPGTWNASNTNWTNSDGLFNLAYVSSVSQVANFGGVSGGAVTVVGTHQFGTMNFTAGGYVLSGAGGLADGLAIDAGTINVVGASASATINVAINGSNGLTKIGAGELVLGGSNGYTGGTNVNLGILTLASDTATGTGLVSLANGTTLRSVGPGVNRSLSNGVAIAGSATFNVLNDNLLANGSISGGELVLNGGGRLVFSLANDNSYTGGTLVQQGGFQANRNLSLGSGAVTMTGGTYAQFVGNLTVANNFTLLAGRQDFTVSSAGNNTVLNGLISGDGGINKQADGRLVLGNAGNSFAGDLRIFNGTVASATATALGAGNIVFTSLGGTLETLASYTTAKTVTLDAAGTINTNANTNRFDGLVSGASPLTKTGSGTLILTGTNGFTGGTNLNAGTIQISNGSALGTAASTLTAAGGTTLIAGLAINTSPMTLAQDIVLNAGEGILTINLLGNAYGVNVTTGALSTNGTALTLDGTISGAGGIDTLSFLNAGGGSILFNSTNSYSGGTNLGSVIAYIGADGALGSGAVNFNAFGAGIQNTAAGTSFTLGNAINVNDAQHSLGGAGNLVLSGAIGGTGDLFKVNVGTVTFTGAGSGFGGSFAVNGGTVAMNGSFTNAAATMVVAGGATLAGNGSFAGSVSIDNGGFLSSGASPGTLTLGNLSLSNLTNLNFEFGAANTLGGLLNDRVIVVGNLVLDGLLNVTETVGGAFTLGIYNLFSYGGDLTDNGLAVNGALPGALTGSVQINGAGKQVNLIVAGPDSIVMNWDGTDFTAAVPGGQGGNGVWNTANTNWTGEAPGEINARWQDNAVGIFGGAAGSVDVASNFNFAGLAFQTGGYVLNNAGGSINTNSLLGSFISVDGGLTATINAVIGGTGQLFKQGAGTLVLGGNNTLSGNVNLASGTIAVTSNTALGSGSLIATGGTTLASGTAPSQGTKTLANNVVLNGLLNVDLKGTTGDIANDGTLTVNGNDLVLNGVVSGAGGLSATGLGRLFLNGNNNYAGGTALAEVAAYAGTDTAFGSGLISVDDAIIGNASGSVRTLANNISILNELGIVGPNDLVLNGTLSGAGLLAKYTTSTLTLNGANAYADGTELFGGTIVVGNSSALGTGTLNVENIGQATTLRAGNNGLNLGNAISLIGTANLIVDSQAFGFTLSGGIGGTGALTKVGSGNLILNGANGYTGGTALNAGRITVGTSTALGTARLTMAGGTTLASGAAGLVLANAITTLGAGTVDTAANIFTLNGVIDGAGSLAKVGSGTLVLGGVNLYTGGTGLNVGTIQVNTNTALGTGGLVMADGTTLLAGLNNLALGNAITLGGTSTVNTQAFTFTLNGVIGGAGTLAKTGSGNLTLAGVNTYGGGTSLTAGSLTVTNNSSIGTGTLTTTGGTQLIVGTATGVNTAVTLANAVSLGANTTTVNLQGTSLVFNNDASIVTDGAALTLNGVVSGAGALATGNFGTLTLNGDNSYSGGTLINTRSVVYVGSDTAVGTGTVTTGGATGLYNISGATRTLANAFVLNGGTWLGGTSNMVLNGTISGAGFVIKAGAQTLTLNNANSFTGTSQLRDGRITVGTGTALGTGALTVFAPTVPLAPVAGLATTLAAGTSGLTLANNVTLSTGSNLIVESGTGIFTLAGVISGDGGLTKTQSGNLVLNGVNAYTGGTLLNAGRITVGTSTALGTARLTMAGGTTLASGAADLVLANAITNLGAGTVDTAANIFTLNGVIVGAGSLTKVGSGNLVLNGSNGYTGGTSLTAGTIRVGHNSALGTDTLTMSAATILQAGAPTLTVGNNIAMLGGATVDVNGQVLTLGGIISGTGPLSVIDSQPLATDALILTGLNTYTGGTVVTGTTVQVSQDANLGNVAGGITLVGGTLRTTASFATARTVALGTGGGTVDVGTGTTLTTTGVFSGTSLTKIGGGTLALNGANTYAGGTALNAGTVSVGNNAALSTGALAMAGGTTLAAGANNLVLANLISTAGIGTVDTGTNSFTLNGVISGAGSVAKIGSGNLFLNGANTYAGGTAQNAGTITVGNNAALGTGTLTMADATTLSAGVTGLTLANNIAVLGAATINSGASPAVFTLAGVISGAGSVIKQATGILTLTGASTYTGATTVAAGTLNVTGSLVSAVTVIPGAALNGTGTVGALNVLAGGLVNPGAPGTTNTATLTVTGAATLNGTYTANIVPAANDRITAGGALTLGGTLAVVPVVPGGFTQFNTVYTVASGSARTGTFATTTGLDQFGIAFNPLVEYTATQANIRLAPQSLVTLGNRFGGISGNQLEVALAFDRAVAAGYNPQAFFAVYANAGSNLPRTLRELSGEQRATERRVVLDTNRVFRETALDRLNLGMSSMAGQQVSTSDGDRSLTFWLRGAGSWGKAQTNGAATSFQTEQVGLLTGIDWSRDALTVGGMFHFTTTNVEFGVLGGSSRVETVGGTIYGGYRKDSGLVANGGISLSSARANGSRAITLAGFNQSLTGTTTGTTYQFFGELAWDLAGSADTRIEPFARVTLVKANMNGLTETGGVAALVAGKQNYEVTVANLGMRFGANVGKVALNASAAWQGTTGDRDAATIIGIPAVGQNGNIRSVLIDRSALLLQGGVGVNLSDKIRFNLDYTGLIGKRNDDHGGRATLNFKF